VIEVEWEAFFVGSLHLVWILIMPLEWAAIIKNQPVRFISLILVADF
jgi:hypothetical protein